MEIIVGIVIAVLLGVIIYLAYCLKREKENYAYKSKKWTGWKKTAVQR